MIIFPIAILVKNALKKTLKGLKKETHIKKNKHEIVWPDGLPDQRACEKALKQQNQEKKQLKKTRKKRKSSSILW